MAFSFPQPTSLAGYLWRGVLGGPAWVYGAGVRVRAAAYDRGWIETVRVPVPVFCLGNLTVGGSGKTPGVLWLVGLLQRLGHQPVVVSRGYGRRATGTSLIPNRGEPLPAVEQMGDEPRLIARRTGVPLAVGADRALAGERAFDEFRPDCLVMDDGFQHHRIYRDRDWLCFDAPPGLRNMGGKPARSPFAGGALEGTPRRDGSGSRNFYYPAPNGCPFLNGTRWPTGFKIGEFVFHSWKAG
jgi:tetraacyldisaccharide 4'-kinase